MRDSYDIVIVGGGMVGASAALALEGSGARMAIVEPVAPRAQTQPSFDDRGLALSLASTRILDRIGVWDALRPSANPIRRVHVSQQGRFGRAHFEAAALGLETFGHVVPAHGLGDALLQRLRVAARVDWLCPAQVEDARVEGAAAVLKVASPGRTAEVRCRLLIVADGTHSRTRDRLGIRTRTRDYGQVALVANVTPARPHRDTACERFTPDGPLALLPLPQGRCVAVRSVAADAARPWLDMADGDFAERLEQAWGGRFGRFSEPGPRRAYPLLRVEVESQARDRVVLLGNAAHTLHPNGAQGFNLGLRDVAGLAELLNPALRAGADPGERRVLDDYLRSRAADQRRVGCASHGIATLYSSPHPAVRPVRAGAMLLADALPALKRAVVRHATGLHGRQPAWVRGAAL